MSNMILRPKHGSWVLYPSDRPSQREVFAAEHYKGVEVIIHFRKKMDAPRTRSYRHPESSGLTLGYYFAQAITKQVGGQTS